MNLRTLVTWSMAAMLLAGCSGGGAGSSSTPSSSLNPTTPNQTIGSGNASLAIKMDMPALGTSAALRSPKFIGASYNAVAYAILGNAGGPDYYPVIAGAGDAIALTSCPGTPAVCTIGVEAGYNYQVSVTLYDCTTLTAPIVIATSGCTAEAYSDLSTDVGNTGQPAGPYATTVPSAGNISGGTTVNVNLQMIPILQKSVFAANATNHGTAQFYADGTTSQQITLSTNEEDLLGNVLSTGGGPVEDYPTITVNLDTAAGDFAPQAFANLGTDFNVAIGTTASWTGIDTSLNGTHTQAGAPAAPYSGNLSLGFTGVYALGGSAYLYTTDSNTAAHSAEVTIPFVTIADNVANVLNFEGTGPGYALMATVTETITTGGTLDTAFDWSASACDVPTDLTITPASGTATANTATTAATTYTVTALNTGSNLASPGTCTLAVSSVQDPNLTDSITVNFPAAITTTITSHARK